LFHGEEEEEEKESKGGQRRKGFCEGLNQLDIGALMAAKGHKSQGTRHQLAAEQGAAEMAVQRA